MPRVAIIAASLIFCLAGHAAAGEMQPPRLTRAVVDWDAAAATLADIPSLQSVEASAVTAAPAPASAIIRLTAASAERLPAIVRSGVPVLLPFDVAALLRDRAAATPPDPDQNYFFGIGAPTLLDAGPAGYDAEFRFSLAGIPELAGIRFSAPAQVYISGSRVTYELDPPVTDRSVAVPGLEAEFPGITRTFLENNVRYTFTRFGVPYVVSTACFDGGTARFRRMACRDAHRVIAYVLRSLRVVGGAPPPTSPPAAPSQDAAPRPIERPTEVSPTFTYHPSGRLASGTDRRGNGGRADDTVYAAIRFPLADAPAYAITQLFKRRVGAVSGYPWRDNFCERRSFYVDQCPGGMGHQGQDIRAGDCSQTSTGDDRCASTHNDVVAARDGIIMRDPGQEAVYLIVDTATEHLRLRYLHMRPKLLDANGVLSGRRVKAGEVIGQIGNYSGHENGTSYHLHFDIQVPTRAGWVFVSPYMTLVAAYERLIGARGEELRDDVVASAAPTTINDAMANAITLATVRRAILTPTEPDVADVVPAPHPASPCTRSVRHRHGRACDGDAAHHTDHRNVRYGHHGSSVAWWHRSRSRHRL